MTTRNAPPYAVIMVLGLVVTAAGLALMISGGVLPKIVLVIVGAVVMLGGLLMAVSGHLGRRAAGKDPR